MHIYTPPQSRSFRGGETQVRSLLYVIMSQVNETGERQARPLEVFLLVCNTDAMQMSLSEEAQTFQPYKMSHSPFVCDQCTCNVHVMYNAVFGLALESSVINKNFNVECRA